MCHASFLGCAGSALALGLRKQVSKIVKFGLFTLNKQRSFSCYLLVRHNRNMSERLQGKIPTDVNQSCYAQSYYYTLELARDSAKNVNNI